jgi:AraC family transcriptional regulator, transcriptional activator of pobA
MIDKSEFVLQSNIVLTITSGQVYQLKNADGPKGLILEFTNDFFCKTDHDIELVFHNGLFCHFAMNEVINLAENKVVEMALLLIQNELIHQPYQYLLSVHSHY